MTSDTNPAATQLEELLMRRGDWFHGFWFRYLYWPVGFGFMLPIRTTKEKHLDALDSADLNITKADANCFDLAVRGFSRYHLFPPRPPQRDVVLPTGDPYLVSRIRNWPRLPSASIDLEMLLAAFMIADLFYCAIHFFAWNGPFTTRTELLLWRISVVSISAPGLFIVGCFGVALGMVPIGFIGIYTWHRLPKATRDWVKAARDWVAKEYKSHSQEESKTFTVLVIFLIPLPAVFVGLALSLLLAFAAFLPLYLFARTFFIVESVINVAYLADSVFVVPSWLSYIPHIS